MALGWIIRAMDAIPVEMSRPDVGQIAMPHLIRALAQPDALVLDAVVGTVEETQLHRGRVLRENREVDAGAVPRRPLGVWLAGPSVPNGSRRSRNYRALKKCPNQLSLKRRKSRSQKWSQ